MSQTVPFEYQGQPVQFTTAGWINATEIAKRFGRRPNDWILLPSTKEYLDALDRHWSGDTSKSGNGFNGFVRTQRGGSQQGTWLHPKLAVAFARWLDVDFAVWCDLHIDSLLRGEISARQQFDKACQALDDRRGLASAQGRGLAQWRHEKQPLEARVEYWRRELQLSLPLHGADEAHSRLQA
ncbi:ORF11CD3 domain-containing protein [Modicisalibacter ilicicola DSM 19980]|uniref:ORF11CD3 domain-containing protein n=2 Tax=Modicisalibacter ilicicola TaxID=480814 RepID=A0A1M4Y0W8_9GAMM|nr:ORF11CD3 domain-containing protein [Halomonas ilicicola DSM 19980]